jgi:hypothetical protein
MQDDIGFDPTPVLKHHTAIFLCMLDLQKFEAWA